MFGGSKKTEYIWYTIKPLQSVDKQDNKRNEDLLLICRDVSDFLFWFNKSEHGTSLLIRIPKSNESKVKSISSFACESFDNDNSGLRRPNLHIIDSFCTMELAKSYAYPLVPDPSIDSLYTLMSEVPNGFLIFKLIPAPSSRVTKRLNQIKKRNKKLQEKVGRPDPYEQKADAKAGMSIFYYAEMYFGTSNISQIDEFFSSIPYTKINQEPNRLKRMKTIVASAKYPDKARKALERAITTTVKSRKTILSEQDISAFVRFPENPEEVSVQTGQQTTSSSGETYNAQDFDSILNPEKEPEPMVTPTPEEHAEFQVSHIPRDPIDEMEMDKNMPPPHESIIDKPTLLEDDTSIQPKPIDPEIPKEVIQAFKTLEEYILKRNVK